jgi:hypothetical protein
VGLGLLLSLLSSAVALTAVEAGFRLLAPQPTKVSVAVIPDHDLIYRLPAYAIGTDVKDEFAVSIRTNGRGLRDRDYPLLKPAGTVRRILVLGDSMTFAEGVESDETYPKLLERALEARYGASRYEIINAAIRGYGNDQELVLFEQLVPAYHPDVALLAFFAVNDPDDNLYGNLFTLVDGRLVRRPASAESSAKYRYYGRQANIQNFPGYAFAIRHSHALNWLRRRWAMREFVREFGAPGAPIDAAREKQAWQLTRAILTAWVESARHHHVRPLLALIPSPRQVLEGRHELVDRRAALVLGLAQELGVDAFDLRPPLQAARSGPTPLYWPKDGHLTARGHRVVAAFLEARLAAVGVVP